MEDKQIESNDALLKNFAMELASKLQNNKIQIDEVKGVATVQGMKGGKIFSFSIEQQDCSEINSKDNDGRPVRKSDYKKEIKRLYKMGFKQIEIARRLNISQSTVSNLLNEY